MSQNDFKSPWSSFAGFRKKMAAALKKAKAPEQIVFEAGYIDCEDAGIAADLFAAYENIEYDIKDAERLKRKYPSFDESPYEIWEAAIDNGHIQDCVIEIYASYSNLWNYAPGHKPEKCDVKKLAKDVNKYILEDLERTNATAYIYVSRI